MLGHYFTVALRNLVRYRLHTAVSIVVLTLGLTCFLAAYLFVSYLTSYDRHFANADRSYVIFQGMHGPKIGFDWPSYPYSSDLLAPQLALDVPELEAVARYRTLASFVEVDGKPSLRRMAVAERGLLTIFGFDVVAGNLSDALVGRNAVVTAGAAQALFGTTDVVGRTVTVRQQATIDVTLVAVIADPPLTSTFSTRGLRSQGFELLLPWDALDTASPRASAGWYNTPLATFVLAPDDRSMSAAKLDERLASLVKRRVPDEGIEVYLNAKPVSAITTGIMQSQFQGFQGSRWRVDVFTALLTFAATVLVVACVNFVNLATARAAGRVREIGVRKAIGAASMQVIRQELFQTALLAFVSTAVALAAFVVLRRLVQPPWRLAFAIPWGEPRLWMFLAALVAAVTLLAGSYPALVLARVRPVTALRAGTMRVGSGTLRTLLVGSQFALASLLVFAVVVVYTQRANLRETLLGRFADPYLIVLPQGQGASGVDRDVVTAEVRKVPGVKAVTSSAQFPWQFQGSRLRYSASPGEDGPMITTETTPVGYDYFATMEVPVIAGRAFARDRNDELGPSAPGRSESLVSVVILDRDAARALGWANPAEAIGKQIYQQGDGTQPLEVIGVVESVPTAIRERGSQGMVYALNPRYAQYLIVRISKEQIPTTLEGLDGVFKAMSPTGRGGAGRMFLDLAFENAYATFAMINTVFLALGAFAIAIAAVGLFGMASYMTSRRTREIGLRKSQGASSRQILQLLLLSFARPVLIANVVVWPFAFIAAQRYLDGFARRMTLTPWPFAAALLATLLVACVAVGGRVLRAARLRPTDALRQE